MPNSTQSRTAHSPNTAHSRTPHAPESAKSHVMQASVKSSGRVQCIAHMYRNARSHEPSATLCLRTLAFTRTQPRACLASWRPPMWTPAHS
eukprot:6206261-Pleurochrysis_carterae.AAC.4